MTSSVAPLPGYRWPRRIVALGLTVSALLLWPGAAAFAAAPPAQRLSELLALPEGQMALADALPLLAEDRGVTPGADHLAVVDAIAAAVGQKLPRGAAPAAVAKTLADVIHHQFQFGYTERVDAQGMPLNPDEVFFHGLLKTRRGYCMTLSLLYLLVGEKLDLPLYGAALPNHFFVRYEIPGQRLNIETTQDGAVLPDSYYQERFAVAPATPFFMRSLTKRQTLGAYFSNLGVAYYRAGKTEQALFYLRHAAAINPGSIEARNNLGNVYAETGQADQAIEQYAAAAQIDPGRMESLFNLGLAHAGRGDGARAIEALLQAAQIDPAHAPTHELLARLYIEAGRPAGALLHLQKLAQLAPEDTETRLRIADVYLFMKQPEIALDTLRQSGLDFRENKAVGERLAEIYYQLEDYDRAIAVYRSIVEQDPQDLVSHIQLGWTFYRKGDTRQALAWTRRGLVKGKGSPEHMTLGAMNVAFFQLVARDHAAAKADYRALLRADKPADVEVMAQDIRGEMERQPRPDLEFFLGWLYGEAGRKGKAEEHLRRYLEREQAGPHAGEAREILERLAGGARPEKMRFRAAAEGDDSMTLIPDGAFIMGSNRAEDERPAHEVYLDAFLIHKYEVNARDFAEFLNAAGNDKKYYAVNKYGTVEFDGQTYRARPGFEDYPANNVSWAGADAYCQWKKMRLPTEAEWEKAARGVDGRMYPWGNEPPSPERARFFQTWTEETGLGVMAPTRALPDGQSPYGIFNMSGNVKEWVSDWYDADYYGELEHKTNPQGPPGGEYKVLRGGSWHDLKGFVNSTFRNNGSPEFRLDDYGFRCARDAQSKQDKKMGGPMQQISFGRPAPRGE